MLNQYHFNIIKKERVMVINKLIINNEVKLCHSLSAAIDYLKTILQSDINLISDGQFASVEIVGEQIMPDDFKLLFKEIYQSPIPIQISLLSHKDQSKEEKKDQGKNIDDLKNTEDNQQLAAYNAALAVLFRQKELQYQNDKIRDGLKLKKKVSDKVTFADLRRSKINMVNSVASNMQLQQQQQQQQQQKKVVRTQSFHRKKRVKNEYKNDYPEDTYQKQDLITKENIIAKLGAYFKSLYPNEKEQQLLEIWDNLTGKHAAECYTPGSVITHVDTIAMKKIIAHAKDFQEGLVFEHLPVGFDIKRKTNDGHVSNQANERKNNNIELHLYYDEASAIKQLNEPLSDAYRLYFLEDAVKRPSYLDFVFNAYQNQIAVSDLASCAYDENSKLKAQYQQFINNFNSNINSNKSKDKENSANTLLQSFFQNQEYTRLIKSLGLENDTSFKIGLSHIIFNHGIDSAALFLEQLTYLKMIYPNRYNSLYKLFIKGQSDYAQFATIFGKENLKFLSEMKSNEFNWWLSLTGQHIAAGSEANFNVTTEAFKAWLAKIKQVKKSLGEEVNLPEECTLKDIKNMVTALGRVQFIIGNESNEEQNEQINELLREDNENAIDLGNEGAYYAKKFSGYHIVASTMKLQSKITSFAHATLPYQSITLAELMQKANDVGVSYESLRSEFFRILGQLDQRAFSLEEYANCLAKFESLSIDKNAYFLQLLKENPDIKKGILGVILSLMIEPRESQTFENPSLQMEKLINYVNSVAKHERHDDIVKNLFVALFTLAMTPMNNKPKLEEVLDWCKQAENDNTTELNAFLSMLPNVLAAYDKQIFSSIEILQERNKAAENKNAAIASLSLSHLFKLLDSLNQKNGINGVRGHINPNDHAKLLQLAGLLPTLADAGDEKQCQDLYSQLLTYDADFVDAFSREYSTLNFARSTKCPTYKAISTILDTCYHQFQINPHLAQQNIKNELSSSPLLNDVVFGSQTLEQSKYGVVDVIKYYFLKHDVTLGIKAIKKTLPIIQGGVAVGSLISKRADLLKQELDVVSELVPVVEDDVNKLIDQLTKETNAETLHECLEILSRVDSHLNVIVKAAQRNGLEKEITSFMDKFVTKDTDLARLKDQFLANPSIIIFMSADITASFDKEMIKIFKRLNIMDSVLDHACREYLGHINNDGDLVDVVETFAKRFETITSLTNHLTYIKNHRDADFLIINNMINDLLVDHNTRLPIDKINDLLATLLKFKSIPITDSFANVFQKIIASPSLSTHMDTLLSSLNILVQLQKVLPDEELKSLINSVLKSQTNTVSNNNVSASIKLSDDIIAQLRELLSNEAIDNSKVTPLLIDTCKIAMLLPESSTTNANAFIHAVFTTLSSDSLKLPGIVDFINMLFKAGSKDINLLVASYASIMQALLSDKSKTPLLLDIINNVMQADEVAQSNANLTMQKITQLIEKLNSFPLDQVKLEDIASLYKKQPYPHTANSTYMDSLFALLNQPQGQLKTSLTKLDNDPFNRRNDGFATKQFNTDRVVPVIAGIQNLLDKQNLSFEEMQKLGRQCLFVNSIGKDFPPPGFTKPLIEFSRAELYDYASALVAEIRAQGPRRETLPLEFLAVLREVMHRTTGEYPYTTQLISALHSLNHNNNLLLQINTGEGKSITSALLAVMQWANGESVDVCTANMDLASRDFDHFKNFFAFLDIPANKITADGTKQNYQIGGINYSTVADLSLYRSKAKLENNDLKHINGIKIKTSLILDEVDFNTLDNRTLFNHTSHANDQDHYLLNCEWIYPLINDYIDSSAFSNLNVNENAYSANLDLSALETFLKNKITDPAKLKLIAKIKDEDKTQFNRWIDAADEAKQLKYENDYAVSFDEVTGVCTAIPKNKNNLQPGSTYRHGVQQFLHARLQKEYKGEEVKGKNYRFPIEAEHQVSASESSKTFIDYYDHEGRIIGMSGTLGTENELLEQQYNLHAEIYSIPPHNKNIREVAYQPQKNNRDVIKAIRDKVVSKKQFYPHIEIVIDRSKENKSNVMASTQHFSRREWSAIKELFTYMVEESKNHKGLLPGTSYSDKLTHTLTTSLLNANTQLFKGSVDLQSLVNKILQREDLTTNDLKLIQHIATNTHFKFQLLKDVRLPQPTLVITKDSLKAQETFQALTGLPAAEWEKIRQNFRVLGSFLTEDMKNNASISYEEYAKRLPYISALKPAKETIFKDAGYIKELIDKISAQQDLNFYELRTLKAISENNYYCLRQHDFEHFRDLVFLLSTFKDVAHTKELINRTNAQEYLNIPELKRLKSIIEKDYGRQVHDFACFRDIAISLLDQQSLPKNSAETIIYCTHDTFKYEPEIARILTNINVGNRPNNKELASLMNAASKPWYHFNKGEYFEYELVVGDENELARERKTEKAGNPYTITISTTLMGRGVDVKALHTDKTLVIQTYLDTVRNTEQIIGRCARNGEPGKYFFIYDVNENNALHQLHLKSNDIQINHQEVSKAQCRMDENAAVERYYVQEVDNLSNIVMREFQRLEKFMHELTYHLPQDYEYHKRQERVRNKRIYLIQELEEIWKDVLEQSDPENKYYENPYIRRNSQGELQFDDLDKALIRFESKIKTLWSNTRNEMINDYILSNIDHAEEKEFTESKLNYLRNININDIFAQRKQIKSLNASNTNSHTQSAEQDLRYTLDQAIVYHDYTNQQPSAVTLFRTQANRYKIILDDIKSLIANAQLNPGAKDKLFPLLNNIDIKDDISALTDDNLNNDKKQQKANHLQQQIYTVLLAYKKQCRKIDDKYAAQSIAYNLLNMTTADNKQQTNAQKALANKVKRAFLESAVNKLTKYISKNFEWANHKHSLQYLLERKEFCQAAKEILDETKKLEMAPNISNILHLQYLLERYRLRTKGLWSFNQINPFSHASCQKIIQEALSLTHKIRFISQRDQVVPIVERPEIKAMATYEVVQDKVNEILNNRKITKLNKEESIAYQKIASHVKQIINQQASCYVYQLNDLQYVLNRYQAYYATDANRYSNINVIIKKLQQVINDNAFASLITTSKVQETDIKLLKYRKQQILAQLLGKSPALKDADPQIEIGIKPRGGENYYELTLKINDTHEPEPQLGFTRSTNNSSHVQNKANYWLTKLNMVNNQIEKVKADSQQILQSMNDLQVKMQHLENNKAEEKLRQAEEQRDREKLANGKARLPITETIKGWWDSAKSYLHKSENADQSNTPHPDTVSSNQLANAPSLSSRSELSRTNVDEQLFAFKEQMSALNTKGNELKSKMNLLRNRKIYIEDKIMAFNQTIDGLQQTTNQTTYKKILPSTEAFRAMLFELPNQAYHQEKVAKPTAYDSFKQHLHHFYDQLHNVSQSVWQFFHHASLSKPNKTAEITKVNELNYKP